MKYPVGQKVALITGAARGIGFGTAKALHRRGARLALLDVDGEGVAAAAATFGDRAFPLAADVTDPDAMNAAVAATVERFGALDIVVANAGIAPTPATARTMDRREFERVIEVNLLGVYRTVSAGLDEVVARRGQAVLVSSVYAFANGVLLSPYATAKAGVEQLGRALRLELAVSGASATVAYFGLVDTDMVRRARAASRVSDGSDGMLPAFLRTPITPEQAGEAVAQGIERRRARVIAPRYWAAMSVLRGLMNPPFDYLAGRAPKLRNLIGEAERAAGERGSLPSATDESY